MSRSPLEDAFEHHLWATLRLIDACASLEPTQLSATAPGTYGSILDTLRHLVGADTGYLAVLTDGRTTRIDAEAMDLAGLRSAIEADAAAWRQLLGGELDPDRILVRRRDDGSETRAPVGIRLAQALHHGTDHRSQVCTVLTTLGVEPPAIDVWDFADAQGRLTETPATS